ncbi:MAG: biotin--[acetyl-CoA-carboxylase] ligase [Butyrivibrio sp.]|uniref:biotin--[acetyl-CoA-carboxylase] ligase n=1 Tax=Butyrivibrio sp. TaxID=28121 RepID=UPI001B57DBE2|nr:biotin--[acetyl-CoA-carboxylase] ligase [Butyrivibrio sp.]MBP3784324.1 biotin--[acetyl-CoA-carboxylase] ligase [Butyrivibrio sp.]
MLSKEEIERRLTTRWAACNIVYKDITDSTNNDARDMAAEGAPHGTLVVADKQEAGRGSRGRSWETPAGTNIAMSLVIRPTAPADRISMLTLVMGLSVAEGVDLAIAESSADGSKTLEGTSTSRLYSQIKWPNDVVIDKKKICGILTELHMNPDNSIRDVVIGVGINVNMTDFPDEIKGVAGSLLTQTGKRVNRSLVVARVMERFEENYEKFQMSYDLSFLKEQYESRLINKGEKVKILDSGKTGGTPAAWDARSGTMGCALGITDLGELLVDVTGEQAGSHHRDIRTVGAGEVSVRGLYSYV